MVAAPVRVLLVDDDAPMRCHIRQLLADEWPQATVVEAATAEETLSFVQIGHWDAVVLDVRLPGRSGIDILPDLRSSRPKLPIVVMSALPAAPYASVALRAGASVYLTKDRAPEELVETLRRLILPSDREARTPVIAQQDRIAALEAPTGFYEADLIGIMVTDTSGAVKEANDAFLQLAGYDREDLRRGAIRWDEMTPPEWRHLDERAIEQLARSGVTDTWEKEYLRKDGSRVPVLVRARLRAGSSTECLAFVLDDSQRRRAEEALRESEERFRLLVAHVGDAVFMLDTAGRVVTWTPAAERMFGYDQDEALALCASDFLPPAEPRPEGRSDALERALAEGRFEEVGWRVGKGGRRLWARIVVCPIFGPRRELRGFAEILQDRTELRAAEEALASSAAELARSNKELESFASVAAHDLQEPLRKLRTYSDRLKRRYAASLTTEAANLVDRMEEAAARMQLLIDGVLTYSRAGRALPARDLLDLGRVVAEVLQDLSPAIEAAAARVEVTALPSVAGDGTQMRQLFQNLLANALKYARPGVPPEIRVSAALDDASTWVVRVEDNGIGFESKYAERIFGLFQRLHGRSEYGGSGLGLAISRRIVEAHGGTISAEGRPGEGATFTIRLPAAERNVARSRT